MGTLVHIVTLLFSLCMMGQAVNKLTVPVSSAVSNLDLNYNHVSHHVMHW